MTRTTPDRSQPSLEIIALVGHHAGAGATTSAVNLALGLAAFGRSVLLMDLDSQGQASRAFGYTGTTRGGTESTLREAVISRDMIVATKVTEIYLAPSGPWLADIEKELAPMDDCYTRLYQALATQPWP